MRDLLRAHIKRMKGEEEIISSVAAKVKGTVSLTFLLMHCIQFWPRITARLVRNLKI